MQTEARVLLVCEADLHPENNVIKDGDAGVLPSSPNHVAPKPGMFLGLLVKRKSCLGLIISIYCLGGSYLNASSIFRNLLDLDSFRVTLTSTVFC